MSSPRECVLSVGGRAFNSEVLSQDDALLQLCFISVFQFLMLLMYAWLFVDKQLIVAERMAFVAID